MVFAFLQMLQWLSLMLADVLMALVFKKLNVSEKKAKILKPIIVEWLEEDINETHT